MEVRAELQELTLIEGLTEEAVYARLERGAQGFSPRPTRFRPPLPPATDAALLPLCGRVVRRAAGRFMPPPTWLPP